jgi:hypothetical protein
MRFTPSKEDKALYAKLAQNAYHEDRNDIGHFFSGLAATSNDYTMSESAYTLVQIQAQDWLYYGWWPNLNEHIRL